MIAEELIISPTSPSGKYILAIAGFNISGDHTGLLWVVDRNRIMLVEPNLNVGREYLRRWIKWPDDDNYAIVHSSYEAQSMSIIDLSDPNRAKMHVLNLFPKHFINAMYSSGEDDYIWYDVGSFRFEDGGQKICGRIFITCDQHQDENCDMTKVKRAFDMTSDKYFSNIALQPID